MHTLAEILKYYCQKTDTSNMCLSDPEDRLHDNPQQLVQIQIPRLCLKLVTALKSWRVGTRKSVLY